VQRIIINENIIADPNICHGKPTFKGTRIMVWQILDMLKAGESIENIIQSFPSLTPQAVEDALAYAASLTRGGSYVALNVGAEAKIPA
jgi:uncharacterized protein (DUF433 family)